MKDVDGIREIIVQAERAQDEQIRVSLSDTGMGLPPELAEKIFDRSLPRSLMAPAWGFASAGQSLNRMVRLWATNSDGPGATFLFSLPYKLAGVVEIRAAS